jgi:hypothetical protein
MGGFGSELTTSLPITGAYTAVTQGSLHVKRSANPLQSFITNYIHLYLF